MKSSFLGVLVLAVVSVHAVAQQQSKDPYRIKTTHEKAAKSVPLSTKPVTSSAAADSKNLQNIERQSVKAEAPARSGGKSSPGVAKVKLEKDKPTPPINFNGSGGSKSTGMVNQGSNPYKGRLRQKHNHQ